MTRKMRSVEAMRYMKAKRQTALDRVELRRPSESRAPSAGVTSKAVKVVDPDTRRMVDEFLSRRKSDGQP
jgi:hypothetical protein